MLDLFLNIVQNYLVVGLVTAALIDIVIRVVKVAQPSTLLEIVAVIIFWPYVVGRMLTEFLNELV